MAVLDEFEVKLLVNGEEANEYDDDEEDEEQAHGPTTVVKYVEAVSGALFEFQVNVGRALDFGSADAVAEDVFIDGQFGGGKVVPKAKIIHWDYMGTRLSGHYSAANKDVGQKFHRFQFADLETREMDANDDVSEFKDKYGSLGSFRIECWRVRQGGLVPLSRNAHSNRGATSIPEKALKGKPLDVAASFVAEHSSELVQGRQCTKLESQPAAVFILKYRTRRALQSLMIVERSPSPIPLEARPVDELSREEMAELIRRQRASLSVVHGFERSTDIFKEHPPVVIKEEDKPKRKRGSTVTNMRPLKSTKGKNGETIFHLDSDDEEASGKEDLQELPISDRTEVQVIELA